MKLTGKEMRTKLANPLISAALCNRLVTENQKGGVSVKLLTEIADIEARHDGVSVETYEQLKRAHSVEVEMLKEDLKIKKDSASLWRASWLRAEQKSYIMELALNEEGQKVEKLKGDGFGTSGDYGMIGLGSYACSSSILNICMVASSGTGMHYAIGICEIFIPASVTALALAATFIADKGFGLMH